MDKQTDELVELCKKLDIDHNGPDSSNELKPAVKVYQEMKTWILVYDEKTGKLIKATCRIMDDTI